jgi:hypothetical protein
MLPHFHSEREATIAAHHVHDHQHEHHHHHENQISALDILIDFLGHLGHHEHGEEHIDNCIANPNSSSTVYSNSFIQLIAIANCLIDSQNYETERLYHFECPPILNQLQNCLSDPLRGPPSIT